MACDYETKTEPYDDAAFAEDLLHRGDYIKIGMFPTTSEGEAMQFAYDETNRFELDVYDRANGTITHFFGESGMNGDYLASDKFQYEYGGSLYQFIEAVTEGVIKSGDIGGVIVHRFD